ncbi:STAS domain-containing protein [Smaragdicoccus niigatensis]|uniref:STAS domain-containing protein n=1 Tax=Smaragdicoccus niigatensis TaxID=359359 RepID=UPI0003615C19|nr:STAS domain-containing protein [Smaragdicoccus niigatensis]
MHSIDDGITFVTVAGAVDIGTVPTLDSTLETVLARDPRALVLDLSDVDFLASAGVESLVRTQDRLGRALVIVAAARAVIRPLAITNLTDVLTVVPTLPQAVEALRPAMD